MKLLTHFVCLVVALGFVQAMPSGGKHDIVARHARLNQRHQDADTNLTRRASKQGKRCKKRDPATAAAPSSTKAAEESPKTTQEPAPAASPAPAPSPAKTGQRLIQVTSPQCGQSGACENPSVGCGPNGAEDWLNCGIDAGGWNPPHITKDDLIYEDLHVVMGRKDNPFAGCSDFIELFYQYGGQFNVPPIFLASIAMQESSCNPNAVGGNGEQGLMQITKEKCGGAPNGNCREPWFNIMTGASFLAGRINDNDGNVIKAIGSYNGWQPGKTTRHSATDGLWGICGCTCQNNLDYLHEFANGWIQGHNPRNPRIGKYKNLDACGYTQ